MFSFVPNSCMIRFVDTKKKLFAFALSSGSYVSGVSIARQAISYSLLLTVKYDLHQQERRVTERLHKIYRDKQQRIDKKPILTH